MPATFAEDVKAIEVATGVLSTEGGYSAHASVVARQYGKVSLVKPDMKIRGNKATIGRHDHLGGRLHHPQRALLRRARRCTSARPSSSSPTPRNRACWSSSRWSRSS
ncbi:MAG: PEP-utilizing enzyme [Desulfobacterales bacterium]|nr:PEP-utilizing enzyme [Desulfobacterales bacterium]